jgi:hypothetical protein
MSLSELSLQRDALSVSTVRAPSGELVVRMDGNADLRVQSEFSELIQRIHREAAKSGTQLVIVHMEGLEFLSSGCFKGLCTWIRLMLERSPSYRLRLLSSPQHYWQTRSLNAVQMLAPDLVEIVRT